MNAHNIDFNIDDERVGNFTPLWGLAIEGGLVVIDTRMFGYSRTSDLIIANNEDSLGNSINNVNDRLLYGTASITNLCCTSASITNLSRIQGSFINISKLYRLIKLFFTL